MAEKKYELIKESKITESREIGTDLSHLTKYNEYDKDRGEYVSYYKPEDIRKERKKLKEKRKALKKDECEYEDIFNTSNFVKPKLLEETYNLYRIRALKDFGDVKAGDLGGYIESERNLSQEGDCWVSDKAKVYHNAKVYDNAKVYGEAKVYGNSEVYDNAKVYGEAKVFNYAEISEYSDIYGQAQVYGQAKVYDNTKVFKKAQVYGEAKVYGSAEVYDEARVYGNTKVYGNAEIFGEDCWVYNNAEIYDNAQVYDSADVRDNAKVFGNAQVFENAQIYGNAKVSGNAEVYGTAQVYDNTLVSGNTKIFDTENKKYEFVGGDINDVVEIENTKEIKVEILENEIQKYEEHCSKVVDKLKLQDELPNFQVISQKGVLYEKNSENNNISEIKNFVENLKGEEFWDNMSLKDIRDWKELRNDEVVTIVYESKDDRDNITLEEFTDYNDYAKDTVKNALEKEFKNNPDTIESLKKDILDKVPNKEVVKEKVEVVKDIEKEEKATNKTFGYRGDF